MIQKVVSGPNIQSPAAIRKNRTDLATQTHNPISAQSRDTACLASLTDFHAGNGGDIPGTWCCQEICHPVRRDTARYTNCKELLITISFFKPTILSR
jgi:hypothetical protein